MRYLIFALLTWFASPALAVQAVFLDRLVWNGSGLDFGGFSGIEVSADGGHFTAISDKGHWTSGDFDRANGRLVGVTSGAVLPLRDPDGSPLVRYRIDAEGLAMAADGTFFVSFEGFHRIRHYRQLDQANKRVKRHPDFQNFQNNAGLEALAIDAGGVLYSLPERSGEWTKPFPVYRYKGGKWTKPFTIIRRDKFLPVGADFGPDGKFYLLERDFVWYKGFASRLRRFDLTSAGFINEEILLTSHFGDYDNLEGLSAWQDDEGQIRLTAVSDNNFIILQTTEFVEFLVLDTP